MYTDNYKSLLKETKDLNNGNASHFHGIEGLILLKWQYSPKQSIVQYDLSQNPNCLFFKSKKADPKIHMEFQGTPNSPKDPKKEQSWGTHAAHFQNLLQSYSNQNSMVLK